MLVEYVGSKFGMPVYEPVGETPRKFSKIYKKVNPGEKMELSDVQAIKLTKLDPINFKLCGDEDAIEPSKSDVVIETRTSAPPKKRIRRTKAQIEADKMKEEENN